MTVIIGLGNPGPKFENTWHNLGFLVLDEFAQKNNFSEFKFNKKFQALISEDNLKGGKIILAKPQTFMNESGKTVKKLLSSATSGATRPGLVVIHDDIDLSLSEIKIVKNRGSAGHKGVESIIKTLGTKNFIRLRIGIHPQRTHGLVRGTEKFVLQKFSKTDEKIIKEAVGKAAEALETALKEGIEKAMNEYNK